MNRQIWDRHLPVRGRSSCYFCKQVRDVSELRVVHVADRSSGVYACRLDLAPNYCAGWQRTATREGDR
jgi:hypothetical protein